MNAEFTFEKFCAEADRIVDELPEEMKRGVAVFGEEHQRECQAFTDGREKGRDLIFGYFQNFYGGKRIVLCYWAFKEWARSQGVNYDWQRHLWDVVAHEFQHYLESDLTYQPLAEAEKEKFKGD